MPRATAAVLLVLATLPRSVAAQGEDARPLRAGTLRISLAPDWSRWDHRFGEGTPGFADGALEPAGVDFSTDSLGTAQLPFLTSLETRIRNVTGLSAFRLNLGRARLTLNHSYRVVPLALELGLTRRLAIGVVVPIVRSRVEVFLLGPDTAGGDAATRGNVGWNPAYLTAGSLDGFRLQVDSVLQALAFQATNGPPALQAQAQAMLDALGPPLCELWAVTGPASAADAAGPCAAFGTAEAAPFLPDTASEAGRAILAWLASAQTSYDQLSQQYAAQGITLPGFASGLMLPLVPLDSTDLRRFFFDRAGPVAADSLTSVLRTRLGDIEVGATFQLADRARLRSQLAVVVRLPTGYVDSKDNLVDVGTGDHQLDVEVGLRTDLVLGRALWVHAGGRFGRQFADQLERRVSPANLPFAPRASLALVRRDLGDYAALDLVPNWRLDDAFSLGVGWHWFRQGPSRHSYVTATDQTRIGWPASVLDQETAVSRMRVGAGLTFSTLSRYAAGRASLPYTVTASWQNTFWGEGGRVPAASVFNLTIRGYVRIW
jgi:hypothetical protein